jgi:hypothetical protein
LLCAKLFYTAVEMRLNLLTSVKNAESHSAQSIVSEYTELKTPEGQ